MLFYTCSSHYAFKFRLQTLFNLLLFLYSRNQSAGTDNNRLVQGVCVFDPKSKPIENTNTNKLKCLQSRGRSWLQAGCCVSVPDTLSCSVTERSAWRTMRWRTTGRPGPHTVSKPGSCWSNGLRRGSQIDCFLSVFWFGFLIFIVVRVSLASLAAAAAAAQLFL